MEKLSNIPEFYVTNRDFETILWMTGLNKEIIESLPQHSVVLEVGGGVDQNFAAGVKRLRSDITPITIDPTLWIGTKDDKSFDIYFARKKDSPRSISVLHYIKRSKWFRPVDSAPVEGLQKVSNMKEFSNKRIARVHDTGHAISSLAPDLPFKDKSTNLIVDVYGPGIYLQTKDKPILDKYLKEIYRILNIGGEARIFPAVDVQSEADKLIDSSLDNEIKIDENSTKMFYEKIIQENNLNFEISFENIIDPVSKESALVLILKKKN